MIPLLLSEEVLRRVLSGDEASPKELATQDTEINVNTLAGFALLIELAKQSKHWHRFLETDDEVQEMVDDSFDSGYYSGKYGKSLEE